MHIRQDLILIEGAATYERILADVREVEPEEGLRYIQDFLKIYPDFARAHNDLAVMFYQTGNTLRSLAHYEKAHKLDPKNVTYRKNLADFYFVELEWTGEAIHSYLDILKDNPFDTEALNALGTISLKIGRKEQARQFFSRTLQLDSNNHDARQGLQQLPLPSADASGTKQISQAISSVCWAVEPPPAVSAAPIAPFVPPVTSAPVTPVVPAPSFQNLFSTVQPAPMKSPDMLYKEAISLVNADKPSEAIQVLETLVVQNPDHALAHNDLGVLYQKNDDPQKSLHHHQEAVRLQPANMIFQKNLADLLCSEFGAVEEALRIYVQIQARAPQDIEILKSIATICQLVGNQADARYFLERVLTLQPWDRDAQAAIKLMEEMDKESR